MKKRKRRTWRKNDRVRRVVEEEVDAAEEEEEELREDAIPTTLAPGASSCPLHGQENRLQQKEPLPVWCAW